MDGGDEHLDAHGYMHKHIGALGYTRVMTMATLHLGIAKIPRLQRLVMAGGLAYAFGMKPYFRVLGAYAHSHPSTVWLLRSA